MTITEPIALIAAGTLGLMGGFLATSIQYKQRNDELFFKALDFLSGGSQNRNLGIAAIELSLKNKKHKALCVSLLIGSAIYLLRESKQKDAAHELNNLDRIMALLLKEKPIKRSRNNKLIWENYKELNKVVCEVRIQKPGNTEPGNAITNISKHLEEVFEAEQNLHKKVKSAKEPEDQKGLEVSADKLKYWKKELSGF
jgi:hypothetical protein